MNAGAVPSAVNHCRATLGSRLWHQIPSQRDILLMATSSGIDRSVLTVGSDHLFDFFAFRYTMRQIYGRSW
jgi:hypothetical protein